MIQLKEGEIVGKNHRIGFAAAGHEIYLYKYRIKKMEWEITIKEEIEKNATKKKRSK